MNENESSRIPDEDQAWTAARAENVFRKRAAAKFGENPGPIAKQVIDRHAEKAGDNRVADYDPVEEEKLDNLRKKAEELIFKCEFYLKKEFGDLETAREQLSEEEVEEKDPDRELIKKSYEFLLESIDGLKDTIEDIDLDKGRFGTRMGANYLKAEKRIVEFEQNILQAVGWMSEAKKA